MSDLPSLETAARRVRAYLDSSGPRDRLMSRSHEDSSLSFAVFRSDLETLCSRAPAPEFFLEDASWEVRSELNEIREYCNLPETARAHDVSAHARVLIVDDLEEVE